MKSGPMPNGHPSHVCSQNEVVYGRNHLLEGCVELARDTQYNSFQRWDLLGQRATRAGRSMFAGCYSIQHIHVFRGSRD